MPLNRLIKNRVQKHNKKSNLPDEQVNTTLYPRGLFVINRTTWPILFFSILDNPVLELSCCFSFILDCGFNESIGTTPTCESCVMSHILV